MVLASKQVSKGFSGGPLFISDLIGKWKTQIENSINRTFTEQELKKYNGSRKMPVYIAYKGLVYDVTTSPHWQSGEHRNLHYAGIDLTDELADSPHGERVFIKFHVVGILASDE